jgi:hypothetical protein
MIDLLSTDNLHEYSKASLLQRLCGVTLTFPDRIPIGCAPKTSKNASTGDHIIGTPGMSSLGLFENL